MSHCERLPNGVIVRVPKALTPEAATELTGVMEEAMRELRRREDALTPAERADLDARRARIRRIQRQARE